MVPFSFSVFNFSEHKSFPILSNFLLQSHLPCFNPAGPAIQSPKLNPCLATSINHIFIFLLQHLLRFFISFVILLPFPPFFPSFFPCLHWRSLFLFLSSTSLSQMSFPILPSSSKDLPFLVQLFRPLSSTASFRRRSFPYQYRHANTFTIVFACLNFFFVWFALVTSCSLFFFT